MPRIKTNPQRSSQNTQSRPLENVLDYSTLDNAEHNDVMKAQPLDLSIKKSPNNISHNANKQLSKVQQCFAGKSQELRNYRNYHRKIQHNRRNPDKTQLFITNEEKRAVCRYSASCRRHSNESNSKFLRPFVDDMEYSQAEDVHNPDLTKKSAQLAANEQQLSVVQQFFINDQEGLKNYRSYNRKCRHNRRYHNKAPIIITDDERKTSYEYNKFYKKQRKTLKKTRETSQNQSHDINPQIPIIPLQSTNIVNPIMNSMPITTNSPSMPSSYINHTPRFNPFLSMPFINSFLYNSNILNAPVTPFYGAFTERHFLMPTPTPLIRTSYAVNEKTASAISSATSAPSSTIDPQDSNDHYDNLQSSNVVHHSTALTDFDRLLH